MQGGSRDQEYGFRGQDVVQVSFVVEHPTMSNIRPPFLTWVAVATAKAIKSGIEVKSLSLQGQGLSGIHSNTYKAPFQSALNLLVGTVSL